MKPTRYDRKIPWWAYPVFAWMWAGIVIDFYHDPEFTAVAVVIVAAIIIAIYLLMRGRR